ncbi:hypothetical protein EVG20_g6620 [Dentipellis fragilis]|uniref:Uncharacterized protein n=1 Tax=Dentipellis fragilis TaxID=205917 RepID=A0A4Y9YMG3_9AGAM|nr:hypothetical protein EVG20_g6620 [Dentipellis fragilis]
MLVVTNVLFGEEAWIEHRVEMDPAVFIAENIAVWWYNTLGLTAGIAMNFMGDGLLLYRCHIIWGSRLRIMAFPFFMYFASIAMAVIYLVDNALPGHNPFARTYSLFAIAWISLSVALNVILTTLISVRLLMMRSLVRSILPARVGAKYTSIVSIFVESALPLSLLGIGLIVTYFVGSPVQLAVSFNWGVLCATSPQLIIFRVAMGSGWSKDIVSEVTQAVGSGFLFATHTSSDAADAQPGPLTTSKFADGLDTRMRDNMARSTYSRMGESHRLRAARQCRYNGSFTHGPFDFYRRRYITIHPPKSQSSSIALFIFCIILKVAFIWYIHEALSERSDKLYSYIGADYPLTWSTPEPGPVIVAVELYKSETHVADGTSYLQAWSLFVKLCGSLGTWIKRRAFGKAVSIHWPIFGNAALHDKKYAYGGGNEIWFGFQGYQSVTSSLAKESSHPKIQRFFVVYGAILLVFLTVLVATNALFGEEAWIEHRAHVDPAVFIAEKMTVWWYYTLGYTAGIAMNFMCDGLLLYRCHIIWGSRLWITGIPFLMYFASIAMAMVYIVDCTLPGYNPLIRTSSQFAIAWISLSVALNVVLTTLISVRLLMMRSLVRSILPAHVEARYTSIVSIFVESALPMSLLGIGLIVTYVLDSRVQLAASFIWGASCATSSQLIIFRVAMGSGWSKDIVSQVTQPVGSGILFAAPPNANTTDAPSHASMFYPSARTCKSDRNQPADSELQDVEIVVDE